MYPVGASESREREREREREQRERQREREGRDQLIIELYLRHQKLFYNYLLLINKDSSYDVEAK